MTDDAHRSDGSAGAEAELSVYLLDVGALLVWVSLATLYLLAGRAAVLRGRPPWPAQRTAAWLGATALGLAVTTGPIARAARDSFPLHTAVHLVIGMLVPLLLVLGAPVTVLLRSVPARVGRRYSRLAGAIPFRLLAHPVTALALAAAPMAVLYWDGSFLHLLHEPVLGPLLHLHFLASGALFAYAVVGVDPNPHRAPAGVRAAVIVAAIAVHGVVSKHLYSTAGQRGLPPDTEQAAQLMYYGGDAVHALLLVVFCAQLYREGGRRLERAAGASARSRPQWNRM